MLNNNSWKFLKKLWIISYEINKKAQVNSKNSKTIA